MTKIKNFSTKVKYVGGWNWQEAKEKLLKVYDEWKKDTMKVLSVKFSSWSAGDIMGGAEEYLEVIYEEEE